MVSFLSTTDFFGADLFSPSSPEKSARELNSYQMLRRPGHLNRPLAGCYAEIAINDLACERVPFSAHFPEIMFVEAHFTVHTELA